MRRAFNFYRNIYRDGWSTTFGMTSLKVFPQIQASDELIAAFAKRTLPQRSNAVGNPLFIPRCHTRGMTYSRDTTALSELTGRPVNTWSEGWRIETEARAVLAVAGAERDALFNGTSPESCRKERCIIAIRGLKAAEILRGYMEQLQEARVRKSSGTTGKLADRLI
jgi:hypothetical protein